MPKICLNMIVKNESKIILRLLESVLPIIDSYCICDTGSTDNTKELIEEYFNEQNIAGKIIEEPFKDFGYNRTFALQACLGMPNSDYILLLDADMILEISPSLSISKFKEELNCELYHLFQGSPSFLYKNVRLVRNVPGISYWGVTHEYVNPPPHFRYHTIPRTEIFINDIGDGGSKEEKFIRDIRLLLKGLEENPNNDRYTYYLANSYKDAGQLKNAIETYKKRIKIGGWKEEVWYSYYSMGKCYKDLDNMPKAINSWMEGYQYFPERIENLYEIVMYYRMKGQYNTAYMYYCLANYEKSRKTDYDHLFLQKDIYDYKLDYELSIIGYYCNWNNYNMNEINMKIMACPTIEDAILKNVFTNYKFYTPKLVDKKSGDESINVSVPISSEFVSSTPSLCWKTDGKELLVNTRYVNYHIGEKGEYINGEKIHTINVISVMDTSCRPWKKTKEFIFHYKTQYDDLYIGVEDIRLLYHNDKVYYSGNRCIGTGNIQVEYGCIDLNEETKVNSTLLKTKYQQGVEKNWVLFIDKENQMKMVYKWYPLTIGEVITKQDAELFSSVSLLNITNENKTPEFFKYMRGSTNGIVIGEEIWFITHIVSYESRRYYYHCFVVLDRNTLQVKKYSTLFTFEKQPVEYTLGFVYNTDDNAFLIGYSVMDKETKYINIGRNEIDKLF